MTDHHQPARPLLQLLDQCRAMAGIQMVAGFIQNQEIGVWQHGAGEADTHRFAATEASGGSGSVEVPKTSALQRAL